jgi:hypothetical protein
MLQAKCANANINNNEEEHKSMVEKTITEMFR